MDRSLTAALLRPRHAIASVLVFLALGGFGGLVVGFAQASDGGPSGEAVAVDSFTLAEPRVGDRGVYELRASEGYTLEAAYGHDHVRTIQFEWLADEVFRTAGGQAEWANLIRLKTTESAGQGEMRVDAELLAIRPGTEGAIARIWIQNQTDVDEDVTRVDISTYTSFQERDRVLPCGFRNPLQGQQVAVPGGRLPTAPFCWQGSGMRDGDERVFEALQAVQENGSVFLRAEIVDYGTTGFRSYRDPMLEFLFRQDIPFPLQIQRDRSPATLVLVSFARGDGPVLRSHAEPIAEAPPPLEFRPRTEWGLDEAGVDHPFPFSAAYLQARDDPTYDGVRSFMGNHAGAYVQRASYQNFVSNGRESAYHRWVFTMTDGGEELVVDVIRRTGALPGPAPLATPLPTQAYDISDRGVQAASSPYPAPESLRTELPTVSSMFRQWEAYRPSSTEKAGNDWGFYIQCTYDWDLGEKDCTRAATSLHAGWTQYNRTYAGTMPWPVDQSQPVDGYRSGTLHWSEWPGREDLTFDHPNGYSDQRTDWRRDDEVAPVEGVPTFPSGSSSLVPLAVAGIWAFPSAPETAAIGFGAFLFSLLYWLKPVLKTGFVGLFSRVEPEELLANPVRAMLVSAVEANPGIHHQELVRIARKGNGAAEHHLQKLVTGGLLTRHKSAGYTCYFRAGKVDRRVMASAHLLKSPVARAIVEAAQRSPGTSLAQIARDAGVSVPTVHYHVQRLQQAGLVRWQGGLHPGLPGVSSPASPVQA